MPDSISRYCVIGIHYADRPDATEFLAINGQIVLFDTPNMARMVVPRLGGGRIESWDVTQEKCWFSPLDPQGFNRISIWTDYDPYDVPNGLRKVGIWSESKQRDWKHHVMYFQVLNEILHWADSLERDRLNREDLALVAA